jgi:hypothetical protein
MTDVATSRASRLRWWFVVVAVATGMIAMHSLAGHEHGQAGVSPTVVTVAESSCCAGEHVLPVGVREDSGPHHHSTLVALLHLCVAVLTGFTVLVIAALLAFVGCAIAVSKRVSLLAMRFGHTRSPPPTSARLAQLCVLRC